MSSLPPTARFLNAPDTFQSGFTLVEMAIVLFIVALLIGGMTLPLSAQIDIRASQETEKRLSDVREMLVGFALTNERLPCPATANSAGREAFCSNATYNPCSGAEEYTYTETNNGVCYDYYSGFAPAVSLGITPLDSSGFITDGWGGNPANRIRYAVSTNSLNTEGTPYVFTRRGAMKSIPTPSPIFKPDLSVCTAGSEVLYPGTKTPGTNTYAKCSNGQALVTDAVAVLFSLGKNAPAAAPSTNEVPNTVADSAFVSMSQGASFDDSVTWLSFNTLYGRMVAAGKLP